MSAFTAQQRRSSLALDLGTTTGWALRPADDQIVSGTVSFRPSRYDGGGIRYLRFRAWLDSLAEDNILDVIGYVTLLPEVMP